MKTNRKKETTMFNYSNISKYRDVIYGLSIIWIVLFYVYGFYPKFKHDFAISEILQSGNIGVDIFLILSGICLYYSMKKDDNIKSFYKKRFSKILKVLLLICMPFLAIKYLILENNFIKFIQNLTFIERKGGYFWFLGCIMICYLLYPLIYKLLKKNKQKYLIVFIIAYIISLFILNTKFTDFYLKYEIGLSRIPAFLIGCILGPLCYEKKECNKNIVFIFLLLLLSRGIFFYFVNRISFLSAGAEVFSRTYKSVLAFGIIWLIITTFEIFKLEKIKEVIEKIGKVTLETYVIHVIILDTFATILQIKLTSDIKVLIFMISYTIISIVLAFQIGKVINKKKDVYGNTTKRIN